MPSPSCFEALRTTLSLAISAALVLSVAGCGGGGGSTAAVPVAVVAPAVTPAGIAAPSSTTATTTPGASTEASSSPLLPGAAAPGVPTSPGPTVAPAPAGPGTPPQVVAPPAAACPMLPGANVAGGEFSAGTLPGRYGYDYLYPTQTEIDLLKSLGLRLMRVPFLWERLQPTASAALDPTELARLDEVVRLATAAGITVVLDAHDYGYYHGVQLAATNAPPAALPDLWSRLATHFAGQSQVAFGLMNEPHDIDVNAWAGIAQRTLAAIRATGATNTVLVPGTNWDGAHSWTTPLGSQSNASALLPLGANDPHVVFEVHQYFDQGYSGTAETCTAADDAVAALSSTASWARTHHVKLFLGEFGVSRRSECVAALDRALTVLHADSDVWYGYAYWSAGAWWGSYPFNIQVSGGTPQGALLKTHAAACPG